VNIRLLYEEKSSKSTSILSLKSANKKKEKAIFFDRDGVLIKDVNYIKSSDQVEICKNVVSFLRKAKFLGYAIVIVTNQSSVSREIISYEQYLEITSKFLSFLPINLYPDLIISSFHLPNNEKKLSNFNWRKPGTGMFDYSFVNYQYDPKYSIMIGDKLTDLIPAYKCGIDSIIYMESKLHKEKESKLVRDWALKNRLNYHIWQELNIDFLGTNPNK
jgi:D-glycero-D-manno-heptose 1,7-bisphosphate phosphatase